jgi:hypothetical protein
MSKVVCPVCDASNISSDVRVSWGMTTSAGVQSFYRDGEYHQHDRNTTSANWSCSNGHKGDIVSVQECTVPFCKDHKGYHKMYVREEPAESKETVQKDNNTKDDIPVGQQFLLQNVNLSAYDNRTMTMLPLTSTTYLQGYVNVNGSNGINTTLNLKEGEQYLVSLTNGKLTIEQFESNEKSEESIGTKDKLSKNK